MVFWLRFLTGFVHGFRGLYELFGAYARRVLASIALALQET